MYGKVDHTPFSFGIVLPEPYGSYRFGAQIDLKNKAKSENYTRYFSGTLWRIHPDWVRFSEMPPYFALTECKLDNKNRLFTFLGVLR